jgi:hypothetical protein
LAALALPRPEFASTSFFLNRVHKRFFFMNLAIPRDHVEVPLCLAEIHGGARSMMLRQCLAIAAATPKLIPVPVAHAPLDRSTRQLAVRP